MILTRIYSDSGKNLIYQYNKRNQRYFSRILPQNAREFIESLDDKTFIIGPIYSTGVMQLCVTGSRKSGDRNSRDSARREMAEEVGVRGTLNYLGYAHYTLYHTNLDEDWSPKSIRLNRDFDLASRRVCVVLHGNYYTALQVLGNVRPNSETLSEDTIIGIGAVSVRFLRNVVFSEFD